MFWGRLNAFPAFASTDSEFVKQWAEESIGTRVGDGECWTLIDAALKDLADTYRSMGQAPPLLSQGRTHGVLILTVSGGAPGSNQGMLQLADVRRGDIMELSSTHFRILEGGGDMNKPVFKPGSMVSEPIKGGGERNIRMARHTAVVVGVLGDAVEVCVLRNFSFILFMVLGARLFLWKNIEGKQN